MHRGAVVREGGGIGAERQRGDQVPIQGTCHRSGACRAMVTHEPGRPHLEAAPSPSRGRPEAVRAVRSGRLRELDLQRVRVERSHRIAAQQHAIRALDDERAESRDVPGGRRSHEPRLAPPHERAEHGARTPRGCRAARATRSSATPTSDVVDRPLDIERQCLLLGRSTRAGSARPHRRARGRRRPGRRRAWSSPGPSSPGSRPARARPAGSVAALREVGRLRVAKHRVDAGGIQARAHDVHATAAVGAGRGPSCRSRRHRPTGTRATRCAAGNRPRGSGSGSAPRRVRGPHAPRAPVSRRTSPRASSRANGGRCQGVVGAAVEDEARPSEVPGRPAAVDEGVLHDRDQRLGVDRRVHPAHLIGLGRAVQLPPADLLEPPSPMREQPDRRRRVPFLGAGALVIADAAPDADPPEVQAGRTRPGRLGRGRCGRPGTARQSSLTGLVATSNGRTSGSGDASASSQSGTESGWSSRLPASSSVTTRSLSP